MRRFPRGAVSFVSGHARDCTDGWQELWWLNVSSTLFGTNCFSVVISWLWPRSITGMPIFHESQRYTACCQWPGEVKLTEKEITRMAIHLHLDEREFIEKYTRLHMFRTGLSLAEKPNGECIFLDGV